MIKVEYLRVGNYLLDEHGEIFQVKQIGTGLIESYGMYIYEIEEIKPIGLTEEILLKCGFEKHSTNPFWFRKKQICISLSGSIELISWDMQVFKIDSKAEYLHQLQNLYFALTGQELEINL